MVSACGRVHFGATDDASVDAGPCAINSGIDALLPRVDVPVAAGPYWVALADLDLDGSLDVVAPANSVAQVSTARGRGDGTFEPFQAWAVDTTPLGLAVGILGGENGFPDIVVAHPGPRTVTVLPNDTRGGFLPAVSYPSPSLVPRMVAITQVENGALDVIIAGASSGIFDVRDGTANDASFSTSAALYGSGTNVWSLGTTDLDNDQASDLVVLDAGGNGVRVHLNDHTGGFLGTAVPYAGGTGVASITFGDVDGNGTQDVITTEVGANVVAIYRGNGDGTLQAPLTFPTAGGPAADVTGDGALDLATASDIVDVIALLVGNGDGTFQPFVTYPTGASPYGVAAGDVDGDGRADLAVANRYGDSISILRSRCDR